MGEPRIRSGFMSHLRCAKRSLESCARAVVDCLLSMTFVLGGQAPVFASTNSAGDKVGSVSAGALPGAALSSSLPDTKSGHLKRSYEWRMGVSGQSFATEKEQAQTFGFGVSGRLRHALLEPLELQAEFGASMQSGYAQSRFGDQVPSSEVALQEALIQYKPARGLAFLVGAINQRHLQAPLLVSGRAFPGVLEKVLLGNRKINIELRAQQAIPTSTTLSSKAVETEVTPSFFTETLILSLRPHEAFQMKGYATHFQFRDLPSAVAFDSALYGNTLIETSPKTSRFRYQFEGWLAGGELKWQLTSYLAWAITGQMIQNSQAPDTYKNAQITGMDFELKVPHDIDIKPGAEVFFAESDVTPGYYNSSDYGHNNRSGWSAKLDTVFNKEKFRIGARFVQSNLINFVLDQSEQRSLMVEFETLYEVL